MAVFDYVVGGIVALSLALGLWRGVVSELIALAAWVLAYITALEFGAPSGQLVFGGIADPAVRALAGCALVFVAVLVAMSLVRLAVRSMVKALGLTLSDRLLGMFFGLARGVAIVMALVAVGGLTAAPQQIWWKQAILAPPLETAVLAARPWLPEDLAKRIRFS
ncbi:MAG TPA: CvpA family protein [Azonexus sp.]|jgi:membrane protein required for colicin V production|nr:CvpA family protein [Azonexus sp.]